MTVCEVSQAVLYAHVIIIVVLFFLTVVKIERCVRFQVYFASAYIATAPVSLIIISVCIISVCVGLQ